jgi:hypothetical protein
VHLVLVLPWGNGNLPVETKPLGDLERELENADSGDNLGDTFDNLNNIVVQILGKDTEWNGDSDDNKDSNKGGESGSAGYLPEGGSLSVVIPFLALDDDSSVVTDDNGSLQELASGRK